MPAKKKPAEHKEEKKREKQTKLVNDNTKMIVGFFAALLFFGFLIGIKLIPQETVVDVTPLTKEYNGFIFEKKGDFWESRIDAKNIITNKTQSYNVLFHYTPDEVDDIITIKDVENRTTTPRLLLNSVVMYITVDPEDPGGIIVSAVEIAKVAGTIHQKNVKSALIRPDARLPNSPIITCNNVTKTDKVLRIKLGNRTGIFNEEGCIIVEGTNETELLRAAERLSFELIGIL